MTIFLIIGGAAMSLFSQHANLFTTQQGEVGLNMTLRNALQQIQTDAVQAGNGFFIGGATSIANTPVGVTITNNAGSFDSLTVIQAGTSAVPLSGTGCMYTTSGSATLSAGYGVTASQFSAGEVLFMNYNGNQMTVAKLKGATAGTGGTINITYNPTNANGDTRPYIPTIGDLLSANDISWKWYSGGWTQILGYSGSNPSHGRIDAPASQSPMCAVTSTQPCRRSSTARTSLDMCTS